MLLLARRLLSMQCSLATHVGSCAWRLLSTQSVFSTRVQTLLLTRHLLSTQGVCSNVRSHEMSNVHTEYPFGRYNWRGVHYAHRVSIRTLDPARCQLSIQSIRSDAMSREVSTIHAKNLRNFRSDTVSGGTSTIHTEYPFEC